jgi:hypothetical protein
MREKFVEFLQSPSGETYLAIREAIVQLPVYNPYSDEAAEIKGLMDKGELEGARAKIAASMPNLLLSPGTHMLMSYIAIESKDDELAEMERFIASALCEGILDTGGGTKESPYVVLRTSDEHDVLQYLGQQLKKQSLIHDEEQHLDLTKCTDGSEMWFDVSDAYSRLQEAFTCRQRARAI